jgi:hypothetical protein
VLIDQPMIGSDTSSKGSDARLRRLVELGSEVRTLSAGLLPAFGACLSFDEACQALAVLLEAQPAVRRAVLNRVLYLAREGADSTRFSLLAAELLLVRASTTHRLPRIDAVLATLFPFFPLDAKSKILDAWKSDRRRSSKSRWLKAVQENPELFEPNEVLAYWRCTRHLDAAKIIAYSAPTEVVKDFISELVEHCDQGWIIARASLRAIDVPTEVMDRIKDKFPSTYAYICAKTNRPLTHEEALDLYWRTDPSEFSGGRGLTAWSIGYLGMWETLEEIRARSPVDGDRPPF